MKKCNPDADNFGESSLEGKESYGHPVQVLPGGPAGTAFGVGKRKVLPDAHDLIAIRPVDLHDLVARGAMEWGAPDETAETLAQDVTRALRRSRTSEVDAWPEHPDLPGQPDPEPLPLDVLPPALRDWTSSVADSVQVSSDVPALLALAAVSTAVAGKVVVRVDNAWDQEWVTIYVVPVLEAAERKSPPFRLMTAPIRDWETEQARKVGPQLEVALELLDVEERRLRATKESASKGKAEMDEVEAAIHAVRDARAAVPVVPSLLAQDATPEALVQQMGEQGGRVSVLSPEGGPLQILDGRYSDGAARLEELAQAYDGEELRSRRVSRDTPPVRRPALTLGVALQPSVLESVRNGRSMRGQGIYGRICWARPTSQMGRRVDSSEAPPLDRAAERRYSEMIHRLLEWSPADVEEDGTYVPHDLTLSGEAQASKRSYHYEIEDGLRAGGRLSGIRDWAGKTVGRAVRLAALLELAARAGDRRPLTGEPISGWAMDSAIRLCRALTSHALVIYGEIEADRRTADLRYLVRRLQELPPGTTETELRRAAQGRASIEGAEDVADLLDELEVRGCVRRIPQEPTGGRPRSPRLELHPSLCTRIAESAERGSEGVREGPLRTFRNGHAEGGGYLPDSPEATP